ASAANAGCLFGDTLVQMARMNDLETGREVVLKLRNRLSKTQINQLTRAFSKEYEEKFTLKDVFAATDDGLIYERKVYDSYGQKHYTMYIYSAGDNMHGFIFEGKTLKQVARIGDGSIYNCKVGFELYDFLPWFYTN
ncbi:MAG: hypothetical protein U9Q34_05865, partial [Elusimicrobiota bacterium]|nr:hypothetical protein [Elusimicrobiota bacterium]